jgi:hypothetical protein
MKPHSGHVANLQEASFLIFLMYIKVGAAVAKARQLATAARVEPELWRAPFPHRCDTMRGPLSKSETRLACAQVLGGFQTC